MRDWGKTIAIDLIRWILLLFGSHEMRQLITENPKLTVGLPSATANYVRVYSRSGTRLSRGPTGLHPRSDR
jgi:hypothetical protein